MTAKTTVLYVKTGSRGAEIVTPEEVERRYGIPPEKVPHFIALRGDPSDGIPGAKGVGEKTAADLLRRCGDLEGAIEGALREQPAPAELIRTTRRRAALGYLRDRHAAGCWTSSPRPPDRAARPRGASAAARERGMNRLAERLEKMAAG